MDELMKSFEGREEDKAEKEPEDVNGVLAVHVTSMQTVKEDVEASMVDLLQLRVAYCGQTKWFPITCDASDERNTLKCCATRHLSIQLPKDSDCLDNWLDVELVIKSPLLVQSQDTVLAKAILHIHNIIYESPLLGEVELREESGEVFALLSVEIAFAYGTFGYGESFQLQHQVKKPGHFLHHSMFPRLHPPDSRTDKNHVLIPLPVQHPPFIPFRRKAFLSDHEAPNMIQSFRRQLLVSKMTRLNPLHGEYKQKKDRHQKLAFLEGVVLKKSLDTPHLDIQVTARNQRSSLKLEVSSHR